MKIDFKKFKKLESDEKSTTLQHEGGHTLKIAHKGLSEEHRKELDELPAQNLAKGGRAKFSQMYDPNIKGSKASKPAKSSTTMPGSPTEAKKAYTEPGDQGTRTGAYIPGAPSPHEPDDISAGARNAYYGTHGKYPPCINSSCKNYGHPHPNCKCYGPSTEAGSFMAEGGEVEESYCDANREHKRSCEYYAGGGGPGLASQEVNDDPQAQAVQQWAPDSMGTDPVPQPTPDSVQRPQYNMTDPTNMAQPVNPNPEMSAAQQAPPPPDEGSDVGKELKDAEDAATTAQQPEEPKTPVQTFQSHKDAAIQEMAPETQAFKADLDNGHITPETYSSLFAKKDTLGKIGTLFGLMLSGAGAGLSQQPNMLMEMMNKEIDRDLNAQQQGVTNKQNFLKINQQNTMTQANAKNVTAEAKTKSYALARVQMNLAAFHKLVTDTNKLPEGPQKQQAMQTLTMMNQGIQNENFGILDRAASAAALSKTLFPDQNGGAQPNTTLMKSGLAGPEAKEMGSDIESKTIPGIPGRAQRPIPEQTRNEVTAMDTLSKKAADLLQFAKANKGSLSPATRALGEQKAAEMVNFYNSSLQGGILTQGRLHWLDQQIGKNPTSIFQDLLGNNARLNEIKNSNDMRKNIILNNVGLSAPSGKDTQTSAPQEQQSKSGRPMIQKNGKWVYK